MGLFSSDRYNRGRSWHLDRKKYNTQEDWEKPMNRRKRKYFDGGRAIELDYDKQMALSNLDMIHDYAVELDKMVSEDAELEEWVKMKMTRIEQNVADVKHALEAIDKYGQGGMIFKKQLLHVAKYATEIKNMVEGGVGLMSWQEEKLAISAEYIDGLYHHLDYKMGNRASQFGWGGQAKYDEGGDVFKEALWATLQDTAYSIDSVGNDEYVIYLQQDATIDEVSERLKAIGDFTVGDYVMSHPIEIIGVDADLSTDNRIAMRVKNTTNEYAGGGGVGGVDMYALNWTDHNGQNHIQEFDDYKELLKAKKHLMESGLASQITNDLDSETKRLLKERETAKDSQDYARITKELYDHYETLRYSNGGGVKSHYNTGRSWHLDRAKFNKSEDWEIPMNQRKGKKSKSSRSGYTKADKKRGYTYIPNMMIREADVENRGKITNIDGANILDGIYVKAGTKYAEGGMIQALRAFNIDDLDQYERFMYDRMIRSVSKEDALQIIINDTEGDFTQLSPKLADIASEYYKGGGRVKNYKYVPNYMIDSVTVERNGKETEIDGDRILDGLYVKGKVKYAGGGSFESEPLAHYQVGDAVFIDYMDAADYCDENNIDYSEIMKTHEYSNGGGVRVSNRDARYYVANKTRFTANNLDGVFMNGVYVVRSYGYYPIFIYHEGKWYENSDKFSPSTGKQMGQTRPDATIKISKDEMKYLMNNGSLLRPVFTEFDYGGSTMTDESVIHENCVNGEIHCDTLTEIIGHEPNYPYQQVGMMKLEKCFLRPYYRIC